jgi:hypothetical protein
MSLAAISLLAACQNAPVSPVTSARLSASPAASATQNIDRDGARHDDNHHDEPHRADRTLTRAQREGVERVRKATERFRNLATAQASGYTSQYPAGCASSAAGGQGFHYLNPALADSTINLLTPELVMYEPQRNGKLELVGVDYVVPFTAWKSTTPPTLLGVPFMRNEPLGVWALHIWTARENPSGMFAMWNPRVSCAFAK